MSAIKAVQTAMYSTLTADATLMALAAGGVHNDVPDGQMFPHVLITKATETPWHTLGGATSGLGWKVIARTHVYSRYQGDAEALDIHNRIVALVNFQEIPVSGYTAALWEYEQGRMLIEAIDKIETRHLVGEFCVRVRQ